MYGANISPEETPAKHSQVEVRFINALCDVCVILLDLSASAVLEAGP